MRKLILSLGIATLSLSGLAQKGNTSSAGIAFKDYWEMAVKQMGGRNVDLEEMGEELADAKTFIDKSYVHEDTKDDPKTLMYYGKIYMEIPKAAVLTGNETLKAVDQEEASKKGFEALQRSIELDEKERYVDDIKEYANFYRTSFSNQGIKAYDGQQYEMAMAALLGAAQFGELLGVKDSAFYFYGGLAAVQTEKWEYAEVAFSQTLDLGYRVGESAQYLAQAYAKQDKTEEAEKALTEAVKKYPNDLQVLIQQVNFYIDADRNEEAISVLTSAIDLDPSNVALVYTSGNLYESMGRFEDAEKAYKKVLTLEPENNDAKFSLGGLYFNRGADLTNEANALDFGDPQYDVLVAKSKESFKQALPYLEEAAAAQPEDVVILESLKAVYGKLGMTDKFLEVKAKIEEIKKG